jgi:hypothetical protein
MNENVLPVTKVLEDSFVYSCSFELYRNYEQYLRKTMEKFNIK